MFSVPRQRGFGRAARTHKPTFKVPYRLLNLRHSFIFTLGEMDSFELRLVHSLYLHQTIDVAVVG